MNNNYSKKRSFRRNSRKRRGSSAKSRTQVKKGGAAGRKGIVPSQHPEKVKAIMELVQKMSMIVMEMSSEARKLEGKPSKLTWS